MKSTLPVSIYKNIKTPIIRMIKDIFNKTFFKISIFLIEAADKNIGIDINKRKNDSLKI